MNSKFITLDLCGPEVPVLVKTEDIVVIEGRTDWTYVSVKGLNHAMQIKNTPEDIMQRIFQCQSSNQ